MVDIPIGWVDEVDIEPDDTGFGDAFRSPATTSAILWTSAVDRVGVVSVVLAIFLPVVSVILLLGSVLELLTSLQLPKVRLHWNLENRLEFRRAS